MSEDTQAKENDALIAQMLRDAEKAEVPSDLKTNPVIHKGDEAQPAPMVVSRLDDANYYWLYDSRTGEKIPVLGYMMARKLKQRRPDGSYRFTTTNPGVMPKKGTVKCLLHVDDLNRAHYDELGFRTCKKSNITNQHQLMMHMKNRHPQEWAAIEKERTDKEKAEDRALQRLLLASQLEKQAPESKSGASTEEVNATEPVKYPCPKCDKEFAYRKVQRNHTKTCKGYKS